MLRTILSHHIITISQFMPSFQININYISTFINTFYHSLSLNQAFNNVSEIIQDWMIKLVRVSTHGFVTYTLGELNAELVTGYWCWWWQLSTKTTDGVIIVFISSIIIIALASSHPPNTITQKQQTATVQFLINKLLTNILKQSTNTMD